MVRAAARKKLAGVTLIELMVVVAIIAITAAIAAPALMVAMGDRRAGEATHGLVRLGARARTESMAWGRAYVIAYNDTGANTQNGVATLWRGNSNLCSAVNWGAIITAACSRPNCVDQLDMGDYDFPTHRVRMRLPNATNARLCFQPDGEMLVSINNGVWNTTPPQGTRAVLFTFQRLQSGTPAGVQRSVVFPFGAGPRVRR